MAALNKFKLLATQCTVPWTPNRNPAARPVVQIRRRKILRMLLRRLPLRCYATDRRRRRGDSTEEKKNLATKHKLQELFLSSPPFEERMSENLVDVERGLLPATGSDGGSVIRRDGRRSFRQRLVRRHWRPVLVTIPE